MTLLSLLEKWAGIVGADLIAFLAKASLQFPDAKPMIDKVIAALTTALSPSNLVALASILFSEGGNIAQGKFKGEQHPQDLA